MIFNDVASEAIVVVHGGVDKPLTIEYRVINPFKENFYSAIVPMKEVRELLYYLISPFDVFFSSWEFFMT